jgi:hypothetical protein
MTYQRKKIKGFKGYEIDTNGVVYARRSLSKRALMPIDAGHGYLRVGLYLNPKKSALRSVHRLVAEAFLPNPSGLPIVRHLNGIKTDNRLSNLAWSTQKENIADKWKHGTMASGEKHPRAKLNRFQVQRIRLMKEVTPKLTFEKIGKIFDVSASTIYNVVDNNTWRHV